MVAFLISFDIDGTLEVGDPPGSITLDIVRRAFANDIVIGSCSDRSATSQRAIWEKIDIEPHFVALKHKLDDVKERFQADRYLHIGDRDLDRQLAEAAGFEFLWPDEGAAEPWLAALDNPAQP